MRMGRGPARWFQSKQRLHELERALISEFVKQDSDDEGRTHTILELRRVYERLGWSLALENLKALTINYPEAFE